MGATKMTKQSQFLITTIKSSNLHCCGQHSSGGRPGIRPCQGDAIGLRFYLYRVDPHCRRNRFWSTRRFPSSSLDQHAQTGRALIRTSRNQIGGSEQMSRAAPVRARANESVKKPGTVPSAVRGRDVLSMTYGRRGGLSQGFFTGPNARGSDRGWDFWHFSRQSNPLRTAPR